MEPFTIENITELVWNAIVSTIVYYCCRRNGRPWLAVLLFNCVMALMKINDLILSAYIEPLINSLDATDPHIWGLMARHRVLSNFLAGCILQMFTISYVAFFMRWLGSRRITNIIGIFAKEEKQQNIRVWSSPNGVHGQILFVLYEQWPNLWSNIHAVVIQQTS